MLLRVLTWNLLHGRSVPPAGRDLFNEFCGALAGWEWDVALLQEVPPWWPPALGRALGADQRLVLTSRNALLPVRRAIAVRRPDLIKSNGGGCNAILVRGDGILGHRSRRLSRLPERRWVHAVRLEGAGGVGREPARWRADARCGSRRRERPRWSGDAPVVLGGDFNIRGLQLDGFEHAGGYEVDHVFIRGLVPRGEAEVLDRGRLSDHAPVRVLLTTSRSTSA